MSERGKGRTWEVGDRARFFDYRPWQAAGGDHPEGNDRYFLPATVVRVYRERSVPYARLVDIRYDHEPGRLSCGHFVDVTLPLEDSTRA